jgi:hypothetical protein
MKRLLFSVLLLTLLIGLPEVARSQGTEKLNPRVVGQIFFDAMFDGDLQVLKAHRVESLEKPSQKDLDATRKMLNGRRLTVQTAWQTQTRHRAIVVSSEITLKVPDGEDGDSGRILLEMNDSRGKWLISEMGLMSAEESTQAVTEFRTKYSEDAREVPALKAKRKLTVIQVEHADATAVSGILNELFDEVSIVVDGRTNSLFVRFDDQADIEELTEVLKLLDRSTKDKGQSSAPGSAAGQPKKLNVNQIPQIQNGKSSQARDWESDVRSRWWYGRSSADRVTSGAHSVW